MISDLIILFLLFSGVLYLETLMPFLATAQLLLIMIGIIASFILIYGKIAEKEWAHPFAIIFYSFALADLLILVFLTRHFLAFLVVSFFAMLGLLNSVFRIESCETPRREKSDLETYDVERPVQVDATPIIVETEKKKPRKKYTKRKTPKKRGRPRKK